MLYARPILNLPVRPRAYLGDASFDFWQIDAGVMRDPKYYGVGVISIQRWSLDVCPWSALNQGR